MSMFRRPTDLSSGSSSEDNASEDEEGMDESRESTTGSAGTEELNGADLAPTESLSANDFSTAASEDGNPVPDVERHKNYMLASLLEEFCKVRAAELVNTTHQSARYNRQSPEIQGLARTLFVQASRTLAAGGLVSNSTAADDQRSTRESYVAGLDKIGLQKIVDNDILADPMVRRLSTASDTEQMAIVKSSARQPPSYMNNRNGQMNQLAWETNNLALVSHPSAGFHLYSSHSRSHYESSFAEKRLLGKGGFGRVYHTYNLFDKREYAVKKIPLSPKLSQRYKEGGHQELANVLREVQALARLDHCNVVRYHATWIEEPSLNSGSARQSAEPIPPARKQMLLGQKPSVFGFSSCARKPSLTNVSFGDDDGIRFEAESREGISYRGPDWSHKPETDRRLSSEHSESDIWTDGNANPHGNKDNFSQDPSVYVLHVQMSMYPMTLAQYLAPRPSDAYSSMSEFAKRHCFHLMPALRILLGILCGLQYIHAKGLVHRDIKPSNIFVSSLDYVSPGMVADGYHDVGSCPSCHYQDIRYVNPRIGDFGLVAELARGSDMLEIASSGSSSSNSEKVVGTQYYRPPLMNGPNGKMAATHMANEKLDVFALGVVLLELLWKCGSVMERVELLKGCQKGRVPKSLAETIDSEGHQSGIGNEVEECILGMIHPEPKQRWSCDRVKAATEALLEKCDRRHIQQVPEMVD